VKKKKNTPVKIITAAAIMGRKLILHFHFALGLTLQV
jgi:hypothetical protein